MLYPHQFDGYDLHQVELIWSLTWLNLLALMAKFQRNVYFVKSIVFMRCGGELDRDVLYYDSPNLLFLKVYLLIFFI